MERYGEQTKLKILQAIESTFQLEIEGQRILGQVETVLKPQDVQLSIPSQAIEDSVQSINSGQRDSNLVVYPFDVLSLITFQ